MTTPVPDQSDFCWPVDIACFDDSWESKYPEAVRARALAMAQSSLYRLCLGRVGGCPITVRPCRQNAAQGLPLGMYQTLAYNPWYGGPWMTPWMRADGTIFNCCTNSGGCGCTSSCEVTPGGFVGVISGIKIDGAEVYIGHEGDFEVADHESIVYFGSGSCPFPTTQNMDLPDTQPGTFSITYLPAYSVDGEGAFALALLALEFAKACSGDKNCRLPTNVTSVVRQGVSYNIISGVFPDGRTGIFPVDAFIGRYNPKGLMVEPRVWSPDLPTSRTFT